MANLWPGGDKRGTNAERTEHMTLDKKRAKEPGQISGEVKAAERQSTQRRKQQAVTLHREGMTILEAMELWPELAADSWAPWRTFFRVLVGLPLSDINVAPLEARATANAAMARSAWGKVRLRSAGLLFAEADGTEEWNARRDAWLDDSPASIWTSTSPATSPPN